MNRMGTSRRARERKLNRLLLYAFVLVLFAGTFGQIAMLARLSGQSKAAAAVQREIRDLSASEENLYLSLNQYHNHDRIAARARQLGMEQPAQTQIRVVNLPAAVEDTSTQSAENIGAEEMK